MTILFDFDDVLNDLSKCFIQELNRRYGKQVQWENVSEFEIGESFPDLSDYQIYMPYLDGTLYLDAHPEQGAQNLLHDLAQKHTIYVVTAGLLALPETMLYEYMWDSNPVNSTEYMLRFLGEYYPDVHPQNIVMTTNKTMIRGDALIDDRPQNLIGFRGLKILMDKPYNHTFDTERHNIHRAYTYDDVKTILTEELGVE